LASQLAGQEGLAELVALDRDGQGLSATAVHHARYMTSTAGFTRATGSGALTQFNIQDDLGHGHALKRNRRAMTARRRSDK
jgi:hypothetical protein